MKILMCYARFGFRHIIRSPLRTLLLLGFATFNVLSLAYLLHTIHVSEERIEHMYMTTVVHGTVVRGDTLFFAANSPVPLVSIWAVDRLYDSGFLSDIYLEKITYAPTLFFEIPDGGIQMDMLTRLGMHGMLVINDFDGFVADNQPRLLEIAVAGEPPFRGDLVIEFAEGFSEADLLNRQDNGIATIPVLAHTVLLRQLGLYGYEYEYEYDKTFTDTYIYAAFNNFTRHRVYRMHIIGSFFGGHPIGLARFHNSPLIIMHRSVYGDFVNRVGYATVRFTIDPIYNRQLDYVSQELGAIVSGTMARVNHMVPLEILLNDSYIRSVVMPMEQNLSLLRRILPVAVALSFVLMGGLALLLMMQRAKLIAVLRVLGSARAGTCVHMVAEQISVCFFGVAIGFMALSFSAIDIGANLIIIVALSLAGGIAGSAAGAFAISSRAPMDLLQVKE